MSVSGPRGRGGVAWGAREIESDRLRFGGPAGGTDGNGRGDEGKDLGRVGPGSSARDGSVEGRRMTHGDDQRVFVLERLFKCFDRVPDEGAHYSVQLCAEVPVKSDPMALVGWRGGENAGHTFLVLKKWRDGIGVTQCFGFYPLRRPSMWNPMKGVPSEIRDNEHHEINAAITVELTAAGFLLVLEKALFLAANEYRLVDFNCSDFALTVFNCVRAEPIVLAPFPVSLPVGIGSRKSSFTKVTSIGSTPQMLYATLYAMKNTGGPGAKDIIIDLSHDTLAPPSFGECAE